MSIDILKDYVEECLRKNLEPTFIGLNVYYKERVKGDRRKNVYIKGC